MSANPEAGQIAMSPSFLRRILRNRRAAIGLTIVATVSAIAVLAPWIMPMNPNQASILDAWLPPDSQFLLGTDGLGRDILSRLMLGARVSLSVAVSALAVSLIIGTAIGVAAAWYRGWVDGLLMRVVDVILAFPELIVALLVAAAMGMGLISTITALVFVSFPGTARLARSLALSLQNEPFIEAAKLSGTPAPMIMFRHILPNILPPLVVRASMSVSLVIMTEASLSFLGIGIQEPQPSWGSMIRDGLPQMIDAPMLTLSASLVLAVTLTGFNLLGDGLRDILDPRGEK